MLSSATSLALAAMMVQFAETRWAQTPGMTVQDQYKWLFHATRGGEHALNQPERAQAWLTREWAGLDLSFMPHEDELEPLDPWGRLARWNLRPARRGGTEEAAVWEKFYASAKQVRSTTEDFRLVWSLFGQTLSGNAAHEWTRLDNETSAKGYPALHHSPQYERLYRPAYRVVLL